MNATTNLGAVIDPTCDPQRLAFIELDQALTPIEYRFGDIRRCASAVATVLRQRYAPGERIAVLGANSAHYVAVVLGIMQAGLVAVPLNHRFPAAMIEQVLEDSGARMAFIDASLTDALPACLVKVVFDARSPGEAPHGTQALSAFAAQAGEAHVEPLIATGDMPALMLYTSGSTGRPKGVVLSHRSHLWVLRTRLAEQVLDDERLLIAAPLFHMNALALSLLALAAHATVVMLPRFTAPNAIRAIHRWRCTWLTSVPPMIAMMFQETALLARTDLSCVRYVRMGSAPVSAALLAQIQVILPKARVINAYGTTEAGPVVFAGHPNGLPTPALSVGVAHPCVALRLLDEHGQPADEGELLMRSPGMMNGYHNRPDLPTPFTEDGFYRTGDVFRRDEQGFYTFIGRRDDMFVSGGENLYPGEIERMLERHPDVEQACVVPVDDAIKGTKPVAFIVPKARRRLDADMIKAYALTHAPAYQHPRQVWFVDALPLAATNKVDRQALKARAAAARAGAADSPAPSTGPL